MHWSVAVLRQIAAERMVGARLARLEGNDALAAESQDQGIGLLEAAAKLEQHPICAKCDGHVGPHHICPREHACIDCGGPSDLFVSDPRHVEMTFDPEELAKPLDFPMCDRCLLRRLPANGVHQS